MESFCRIVLILFSSVILHCYCSNFGPEVIATKGAVWPKPQQQRFSDDYFIFRPRTFEFEVAKGSSNCNLLQNGLARYWKITQENSLLVERQLKYRRHEQYKKKWLSDDQFLDYLDKLTVNLTGICDDNEYPSLDMDEKYKLWVTQKRMELQASSVWGILRGLETFSQLIYLSDDGLSLIVKATIIKDFPRYRHRGLLIDTARHFLPLDKIYTILDAQSYNKMNVLHWHIIDDQSFPYVSQVFPELSAKGAYNPHTKIYSPDDVQCVIEYARQRGIRVMPEFDSPGHSASWGNSHPEILTECSEYGIAGPLDPSKNGTFKFMNTLLTEVREVFKDEFIHLGGDEVEFYCWEGNANVTEFMIKEKITTYEGLESYYVQKIVNIANNLKFKSIVWEEVFANGVALPNDTVVHAWLPDYESMLDNITSSGKFGLLSACWYLDGLESGGDWEDFYYCDPSSFNGTKAQQELVLGGEACMWGEVVNEYNVISRVWPRASAPAEKLWSAYDPDLDLDEAAQRLEEHTCRMNRRGIGAQPPNGPGYCD